ncbi:uncharacterized protein LOC112549863 [Alligator sinensis]|uniref:Uncharacterized protein LOC112549863 n=1 Tax=Alligator sinensis TaxID=38654 RepID=A0A3Q0GF96_ALLSI|nr:uncharacterized protein LOC112549863 [Alligator sinensis]
MGIRWRWKCDGGSPVVANQYGYNLDSSSCRKIFPEEKVPHKAVQGTCSKSLPTYAIEHLSLQSPTSIYADAFLKEIHDELMSKLGPSKNLHAQDSAIPGSDPSRISADIVDSVLNKLVAATGEEQHLHPEHEEAVHRVRSISRNILQKSGSEQDLYDDVTGCNGFFPQEVAAVIIEELSYCPLLQVVSDRPLTLSQSVLNSDRIADKVLSQVSVSAKPKTESFEEAIPGSSANETQRQRSCLILKAVQPKVDLPAQQAAHYTENKEREEKVEEKLEAEQHWQEEEELQQIEETIQVESSLVFGKPIGFIHGQ